jgi:tetratricopeptide repeat protein
MATIFIFNLIITIDKNLYVIYNIFYNKGIFIMENEKENNKVYIKPFIILFLISIVIFAIVYFLHSKNIENRFNRTLQNYEKSMSIIFDSAIITNGSNENIYSAKEDLKFSFEVGFKMLESSMNEIMKNSNDILQFWFAFLSVIMIVFTIIGFFLNNNILENAKKQLEIVEKEARTSRENIKKETKRLIEENNKNIQEYNLFNLGIQSINSKDYKLAIYYFNEVTKLNPNLSEAYNNRGLAKYYLANNKKESKEEYYKLMNEAIEEYNKAIKLNPNLSEAYNNRGNTKRRLQKIEEAIEDYNKAIELNQYYAEAYNNRGIAKDKLKLFEEAIEDYNKTIKLNPNNIKGYFYKGLSEFLLGKNEEALKDFENAYNLADNELKKELINRIIVLAQNNDEVAIKFCEEHNIDYKNYKE